MVYPIVVLCFASLALIGMLLFLVPMFVKIFAQLNGQLPTLTQYRRRRLRTCCATTGSSSSR